MKRDKKRSATQKCNNFGWRFWGLGMALTFYWKLGSYLFAFCCSSSSSTPSAHFPPHKRFKNVDRISMHTPPTLAKWKTAITDNFCQGSAQSESLISGYDYDAKWCNFSWLYVPDFIPLLESPQSIDFNSLGFRERGALFPFLLLFFGGIVRDEWRQHSTRKLFRILLLGIRSTQYSWTITGTYSATNKLAWLVVVQYYRITYIEHGDILLYSKEELILLIVCSRILWIITKLQPLLKIDRDNHMLPQNLYYSYKMK